MASSANTFTCPRCLYSGPAGANPRFCPRCGLADVAAPPTDEPVDLTVAGETYAIRDRLAFGEVANLYRCTIQSQKREAVFKIARNPPANRHIAHEYEILKQLHDADRDGRLAPFLPRAVASVNYAPPGEPAQLGSALAYHEQIAGPDELYSLEEVHAAYPSGIDPRDMAWIWRRILTVLSLVHARRIAHGAVTPDHLLIEPCQHKLVLVGWCGAAYFGAGSILVPQRWRGWSNWDRGAAPVTDLSSAAKSMLYLLKPDPEPAVKRHLERAAESSGEAVELLGHFDQMIEALWGPRQFRPFAMPPRRS